MDDGPPPIGGPRTWLLAALVAIITFVAFLPALHGQFLSYDDNLNFTDNPDYRGLGAEQVRWMFTTFHVGHYQPMTWLTLGLDAEISTAMAEDPAAPDAALNPVPYHVSANLYHAINAALFFLVALRLFTWRGPGRPDWPVLLASAFAALLFSLHPLRVESVAWITERRDLVSQMFLLLTVLAYLRMCRAERATAVVPIAPIGIAGGLIGASALIATTLVLRPAATPADSTVGMAGGLLVGGLFVGIATLIALTASTPARRYGLFLGLTLVCFTLGLVSKVIVITLPPVLLLLDWFPLGRLRTRPLPALVEKIPFFALALFFGAVVTVLDARANWLVSTGDHPIMDRLAQAAYGIVFYVWKTFEPTNLLPMYERAAEPVLTSMMFIVPAVLTVLAIVLLVAMRRRMPGVLVAGAAYLCFLLPVSGLVQTGPQLVATRYSYLSTLPLALLIAAGVLALVRSPLTRPWARVAVPLVAIAWLGVLGAMSWRYARVWNDALSLWTYTIERTSDAYFPSSFANTNYGFELQRKVRFEESIAPLERAIAIKTVNADAYLNLGNAYRQVGRSDDALATYRAAIAACPPAMLRAELFYNAGNILLDQQANEEAATMYDQAVLRDPQYAKALTNWGIVLRRLERHDEAAARLEAAIAIDPTLANAHFVLGLCYLSLDRQEDARQKMLDTLKVNPNHANAKAALGR